MQYRNGREAENGDVIVKLDGSEIVAFGVLYGATRDKYCNGSIASIMPSIDYACECDCLHVDDVAEILGLCKLNERPVGTVTSESRATE